MKIPNEILSENNYTGERVINVTDAFVIKQMEAKQELQKKLNPIIKKLTKLTEPLDPYYAQIGQLQEKIKQLQTDMKPFKDAYEEEAKKAEVIDMKARAIDSKIMPVLMDAIRNELGEFEEARNAELKNGVIHVTVVDKIEEFVKNQRARRAKK